MGENERVHSDKKGDTNQKHRTRQQDSKPLLEQYHGWDQGHFSLTETPFYPQMDKHAAFLALAPPGPLIANFVMHLQRNYGNRYVQRLVESIKVQPKLTVNAPNDIYEQEADRVADQIMKAVNSPAQRQLEEEEELQMKPLLQRQEEEEEVMTTTTSQAQRQPAEEEEEEELQAKFLLQHQELEEEELAQTKKASDIQLQEVPEEELQMEVTESQIMNVSDDLEKHINATRGSGQPLPDAIREPMGQAFGVDFSGVRVHTKSEADVLNKQLGAKAFTTGQDVFFGEGEYNPGSDGGRKLIAHELTHVVQQMGIVLPLQRQSEEEEVMINTASEIQCEAEEEEDIQKKALHVECQDEERDAENRQWMELEVMPVETKSKLEHLSGKEQSEVVVKRYPIEPGNPNNLEEETFAQGNQIHFSPISSCLALVGRTDNQVRGVHLLLFGAAKGNPPKELTDDPGGVLYQVVRYLKGCTRIVMFGQLDYWRNSDSTRIVEFYNALRNELGAAEGRVVEGELIVRYSADTDRWYFRKL